jgi:uncharacterized Tic20 family protein
VRLSDFRDNREVRCGAQAIILIVQSRPLRRGRAVNPDDSPASAPQDTSPSASADERTWAMIAHFSALAAFLVPPVGGVLGPLVVWLVKREHSAFAADAAKEAMNFNIAVLIGYLVCALLVFVFIGLLLAAALFVFWLVMTVLAGIKASEGVHYRYPFALRIVK